MKIVRTAQALSQWRSACPDDVGFVPTMGGLHEGHLALFAKARTRHHVVVASIYVNPLQFGPQEDFGAYPRTEAADAKKLEDAGVDALFLPSDAEVYPHGRAQQTQVRVPRLSEDLCGRYRPGHFEGVTTVVARLFGLVRPRAAYFGKKDYQQWRIIERMVVDLGLTVEVVGMETVRMTDGLALSTRNQYLSPEGCQKASGLYATLSAGVGLVRSGVSPSEVEKTCHDQLASLGFVPDYVAIRRAFDLAIPTPEDQDLVILAAARLQGTRLIDNQEFSRPLRADGGNLQSSRKPG